MATEPTHTIALHLRSTFDDTRFIDAFKYAGVHVRHINLIADAVTTLNSLVNTVPVVFAIVAAQQGGIALLELLGDLHILSQVKVILIDHDCDVRTAIKALRLGVTEYFTTGATEQEIHARLQVLLSSHAQTPPSEPLTEEMLLEESPPNPPVPLPDSIILNSHLRAIRQGDMWVSLSPIEWRLFEELIRNRGRVVLFSELVRRALHRDQVTAGETSLLRLHMSRLRAKLNAHFDRDLNIITLRGRGYMMA